MDIKKNKTKKNISLKIKIYSNMELFRAIHSEKTLEHDENENIDHS